jgi:hypothetical protein
MTFLGRVVVFDIKLRICRLHTTIQPNKKVKQSKAVPLHAMEALGGRGGIDPTHSRPRH